jgi:hypothetical protein
MSDATKQSGPWAKFLLLLAPPTAVVFLGSLFLSWYGYPIGYLAVPAVTDGHAEAAARLQMLGAFVLLTAVSIGALGFTGLHMFRLDGAARRAALWVYAFAALASVVAVVAGHPEEVQRFVGQDLVCTSLGVGQEANAGPVRPPAEQAKAAAPERVRGTPLEAWQPASPCAGTGRMRFETFRGLTAFQRVLLAIVAPGLMLGLISCAVPAPGPVAEEECCARGERMTTFLYLSAAMLVAGLFFLGALLRWPASTLRPDDLPAYQAHISGIVLYWGFVYSAYIAACYLPAAAYLAHRCGAGSAGVQPLALLKKSAAIFAPAIAGVLGSVIDLKPLLG